MFCPNCGNPCDDGAVFCQGCGNRVEHSETELAPAGDTVTSFTLWDVSEDTEVTEGENTVLQQAAPPPQAPVTDQPAGFVTNFDGSTGAPAPLPPPHAVPAPAPAAAAPKEAPKKKTSWKKILILCAVALVILAGAIVGAVIGLQTLERQQSYKDELDLGERYLEDMEYEKAILAYNSALDLNPDSYEALLGSARAYLGAENYTEAKASFLDAIENDSSNPAAYVDLAELYIQLDENDKAQSLIEEAVEGKQLADEELQRIYNGVHVEAPTFPLPSDHYAQRRAIEITAQHQNPIYYTLDGTEPTEDNGILYTEPIILQNGVTNIKAFVISAYGFFSKVVTIQYSIDIEDKELSFTDPGFEAAVRRALGKSAYDPVMNDEAAAITELTIVGSNISTSASATFSQSQYFWENSGWGSSYMGSLTQLDDLKHLPFLQRLHIAYQENLDLQGLSKAKNLRELSLINVNASNLGPLSGLTSLQKLCLGWNEVKDIKALAGLTKLTHLGLWGNKISDISLVSSFPALTYLDISDNQVKDISAVAGLSELQSFWAYGNGVSDLSPLTGLLKLRTLMLRGNPLSNHDALRQIYPRLTKFDIVLEEGGAQQ